MQGVHTTKQHVDAYGKRRAKPEVVGAITPSRFAIRPGRLKLVLMHYYGILNGFWFCGEALAKRSA
jgi:hypothetical protein